MTVNSALKNMDLDKIWPMLQGECEWGGRDRKKWGRLAGFYIAYFISIFGLFFLIVYWFYLGTKAGSDGLRPLLHGRGIQSPGINYQPRLANANSNHMDYINSNHRDIGSQTAFVYKSNSGKHNIYVDQMNNFLKSEGYQEEGLSAYGNFSDCNGPNYGFDVDKPCLFFRVNKVLDWEPWGIFESDIDEAFAQTDSNILSSNGYCSYDRFQEFCQTTIGQERITKLKEEIFSDPTSTYDTPFVKCLAVSGADNVKIKTFPENGRLAWTEPFPGIDETVGRSYRSIFSGRSQSEETGYKTPLVAVQFDFSAPEAKNINALFHCFMFDRNMEIETRKQASGMIKLSARINL